jgi:two-component system, cell cycle sensor histidine kinase and response regulator CckA
MALGHADELARALQQACRASGHALGVERTGVWFISSDARELRCATQYELSLDRHTTGAVISIESSPGYLESLQERRAQSTATLLEAPVFRLGEVVGVVRHELDAERAWSSRDRHFAGSVADLIAILLEQATRLNVEAALAAQRERLVKAERMEALSRMSAGVAHDFNNILTAILLKTESLRLERAADATLVQALGDVVDAGERGARLVQQLLTFAKAKLPTPRPVDLSRTLREMEAMLGTLTRDVAQLRIERPKTPALVSVDPSQVEQVILNLVLNARDSGAPYGSELLVRLTLESEWALLEVVDRGAGMDAATRDQVFEPFFTTKERGSGLGLSTVYSIVGQAGGSVSVESSEGQGSTFSVRLPRIQ